MKFVNRGYIYVKPTDVFIEWANKYDDDYTDLTSNEGTVYLIEEDFYDDEAMLTSKFKAIFSNELMAISEDETTYPEINRSNFDQFFVYELGSNTFDLEKSDLKAD